MRLHVMERDGFFCVACGDGHSRLDVHHKSYPPGRYYLDVPVELLETLCRDCHEAAHGRKFG